jgi:serine/threonine protein phosphatase PrpC
VPSFINRFFHRKTSLTQPPVQSEAPPAQPGTKVDKVSGEKPDLPLSDSPMGNHSIETPQIIVGIGQSVGIQRDSNEDSLFTLTANLISNGRTVNFGLYIIADGMGGHENGELASSIAVSRLSAHVINTFFLPSIYSTDHPMDVSLQEVMRDGVMKAHEAIKQAALGSGTTLTAALILGDQITIAHVGDSRAYSIDLTGQMQLLTHDHSLVKRLEEIGQITPAEASIHPKRNLLYRALGQGEQLEPDITSFSAYRGLQLILCTDGLWGAISEDELRSVIASSSEPQIVCQLFIESANAAGGPDNISVIYIRFAG